MKLKYGPYSPSRLERGICPSAFYKFYGEGERYKEAEGLAQARGSAAHEVIEDITNILIKNPDYIFNQGELRGFIAKAVDRHPAAYEEVALLTEIAKGYINKPPRVLTPNAEVELKIAVKVDPKTNRFIEADYNDPDAIGRGRADIFMVSDDTTEAIVIDHKTQPNIEAADTFQMGFYAWVISKSHPFLERISTVLHFARFNYYSDPYVWDRGALARIEDEILTRISIIENRENKTEAVPNKLCQYCPFLAKCPAFTDVVDVDEGGKVHVKRDNLKIMHDTGKAVRVAGLIEVLENMKKVATAELKEHVKGSGPIALPGVMYEFRPSEGIDWDKVNKSLRNETYAIFEKHKVDPKAFMGFNQTHSKDVWMMGNQELVKELSSAFPRKTKTEFRGYKS